MRRGHVGLEQQEDAMCDYSLHAVKTRPAKVGDKLQVSRFDGTITRGFIDAETGDCETAVCLLPGTELGFNAPLRASSDYYSPPTKAYDFAVGTFRKLDEHLPLAHHDAIEFLDGSSVKISLLEVGQVIDVLQMPAEIVDVVATPVVTTATESELVGHDA
jgi:hypothetical protein